MTMSPSFEDPHLKIYYREISQLLLIIETFACC